MTLLRVMTSAGHHLSNFAQGCQRKSLLLLSLFGEPEEGGLARERLA
jgi:hypothetical protein